MNCSARFGFSAKIIQIQIQKLSELWKEDLDYFGFFCAINDQVKFVPGCKPSIIW